MVRIGLLMISDVLSCLSGVSAVQLAIGIPNVAEFAKTHSGTEFVIDKLLNEPDDFLDVAEHDFSIENPEGDKLWSAQLTKYFQFFNKWMLWNWLDRADTAGNASRQRLAEFMQERAMDERKVERVFSRKQSKDEKVPRPVQFQKFLSSNSKETEQYKRVTCP